MYNNHKYIHCQDDDVVYCFIGDNHFVKRVFTGVYRDLYCLNSDAEENILFEMCDGKSLYWYKYGFEFPDESTIANKVRIKKHYLINDEMNETNYDFLSNISFDNVFIEITDEAIVFQLSNLHLIPENCTISFLYGNIERIHCVYIYSENIYINKTVYMPSDDFVAIGTVHWYLLEENFKYLFLERI